LTTSSPPRSVFPRIEPSTVAVLVAQSGFAADGEAKKSRELILMLLEHSPAPFSRSQFTPGHITCTGLVLDPGGERILLVHHRRLERWLLPGGHVEPEDAEIQDAARREVVEETGALLATGIPPLVGTDVHGIPPKRGEPFHLHHDLIFFFRAVAGEFRVSEESRAVAWCAASEFDRYDVPGNVRRAFGRVLKR
jgi:8-oxo-dGTP pyrophosphatase MutT (NUDIX family)